MDVTRLRKMFERNMKYARRLGLSKQKCIFPTLEERNIECGKCIFLSDYFKCMKHIRNVILKCINLT